MEILFEDEHLIVCIKPVGILSQKDASGSANMVEQFLTVTYPQIIAMMITYKCVFTQLKDMYSLDLMAYYTFEDCPDIIEEFENQFTDWVRIFQGAWHHRDKS